MTDFSEVFAILFGGEKYGPFEFPEFQPSIWWNKRMDFLAYQTRDCTYVRESFGRHFSVLLAGGDEYEIAGVVIEPFSAWIDDIRKTYPGIGVDGKNFPLCPFIELSTGKKCLFPRYPSERVSTMLPKIREFVGIVTVPFHILQEVRCVGKTVSSVAAV
ncbi:MAG: hypothetical protein WBC29_02090 [Candidatus Moraniibacteriota bacterium]